MKKLFLILILTYINSANAQSNTILGTINQQNFTFNISKKLRLTQKLEWREIFIENHQLKKYPFNLLQTESLISKIINISNSAGIGYLLRYEPKGYSHRFIQQYVSNHILGYGNLIQRVRLEETIFSHEAIEWRARYRISLDIPLNKTFNPKDFYVKIGSEVLPTLKKQDFNFDLRGLCACGYCINTKSKLELGLDYRSNHLRDERINNQYWLNFNWIWNI